MAAEPENTTRSRGRISVPAALGAIALVIAAIVFGVLGPRMGQRGIRLGGTPLSEIRDLAVDLYGVRLLGGTADLESPGMGYLEIEKLGFQSRGTETIELDRLGRASGHWFRDQDAKSSILVLEVPDSSRFVYFDPLGRQRPLLPGERIEESIGLNTVEWAREWPRSPVVSPADARTELENILEGGTLGVTILGLGGEVVVVVAPDFDEAVEIADLIAPGIERNEVGEVAMEGYPWGSG